MTLKNKVFYKIIIFSDWTSKEHKECKSVTKNNAESILKYGSNRVALLQLNRVMRKEVNQSWKID